MKRRKKSKIIIKTKLSNYDKDTISIYDNSFGITKDGIV